MPNAHDITDTDIPPIVGASLKTEHRDGRVAVWRQPLLDGSRRAAGTWSGDRSLICEITALWRLDPDEDGDSLHSLALAMSTVAGADGKVSNLVDLLVYTHPRIEIERMAAMREWRSANGFDPGTPPNADGPVFA